MGDVISGRHPHARTGRTTSNSQHSRTHCPTRSRSSRYTWTPRAPRQAPSAPRCAHSTAPRTIHDRTPHARRRRRASPQMLVAHERRVALRHLLSGAERAAGTPPAARAARCRDPAPHAGLAVGQQLDLVGRVNSKKSARMNRALILSPPVACFDEVLAQHGTLFGLVGRHHALAHRSAMPVGAPRCRWCLTTPAVEAPRCLRSRQARRSLCSGSLTCRWSRRPSAPRRPVR